MKLSQSDIDAIAEAVAEKLRGEGTTGPDVRMIWIQDLAREKGIDASTVYRTLQRHDIPRRQRDGKLKPPDCGARTYVFSLEYEGRECLSTRSVRNSLRRAGRITQR